MFKDPFFKMILITGLGTVILSWFVAGALMKSCHSGAVKYLDCKNAGKNAEQCAAEVIR